MFSKVWVSWQRVESRFAFKRRGFASLEHLVDVHGMGAVHGGDYSREAANCAERMAASVFLDEMFGFQRRRNRFMAGESGAVGWKGVREQEEGIL